jgi:tRNA threonylcarbamoyladenosine biosynthesis protein TsaB
VKLLAIDTATEACSTAILVNDEIISRCQVAPRQHTSLILSMIDELLAVAGVQLKDMDALAYGRGPGAFTGVRIAAGVIQGLAFGSDTPVIPISTLAALAQGVASAQTNIISAIDARMGEIYWAVYEVGSTGLVSAVSEESVTRPEDLLVNMNKRYYGVGTGWASYKAELNNLLGDQLQGFDGDRYPGADDIIKLARQEYQKGNMLAAADALPVYVRNKVTG